MTTQPASLPVTYLTVGEGPAARRIAAIREPGDPPGVVWMQGFKSDMVSTKATALSEWTRQAGIAFTRFDYSGHGQSDGRFEDGTLSRWLEESAAVFTALTEGPQVVVGSSMGGHLALLLLRRLMTTAPAEAARIKALVLIAPAWDMTEELMWRRFPEAAKAAILQQGVWLRPSQYGDPYPITRGLIEDGRDNLVGSTNWDPGRPVRIIQGRLDPDVPFEHAERLMQILTGADQKLIEVPDGEHRLSRPEDIVLLIDTIKSVR